VSAFYRLPPLLPEPSSAFSGPHAADGNLALSRRTLVGAKVCCRIPGSMSPRQRQQRVRLPDAGETRARAVVSVALAGPWSVVCLTDLAFTRTAHETPSNPVRA